MDSSDREKTESVDEWFDITIRIRR
jgi:hypothetical protein